MVDFAGGAERWEIIPGYFARLEDGHIVYKIPAPGGGWIETAPSAHLAYVTDVNKAPYGGAKGLARLIKSWKYANPSSAKVSSFYLEMRAARRMENEASFIPYLDFAYLLRDLGNSGLADMNDPTGLTGRFRAASSENLRSAAVSMMKADAKRVLDAIELEKAGKRGEAWKKLNLVFVGDFPSQFY